MKRSNGRFSLISHILCVSLIIDVCAALQAISQGQSLVGKQSLVSEGGNFELGFFRPGKPHKFYIGIWYKKIKKQSVIWVANRDMPVNDIYSSELKLAEDGNLVLLNHSKVPIWSSNTNSSTAKSIEALLLDTGNLVLRLQQNTSMIIWLSFDHPTDTIVSRGWLGMNKITGEYQSLVSWKNTEDPATGIFTETIDPYSISNMQCSGNDQFYLMTDMQLSTDSQVLSVQSLKECKLACLKSCSCVAYAYDETNQCLIWNDKIHNLQQLDNDNGKSLTLYLRAYGLQSPNKGEKHERLVLITAVVITGFLASIIIIIIILTWRHRRKIVAENIKELKGSLIFFTYADLRKATLNFSEKLGEGSFGSVNKGSIKDSTAIAVKKLEGLRQGEKQFRTEVNSLGKIQHLNLVQLIGFCSEGTRRLLVYELMSNGSLASFLSEKHSMTLTWRARYDIVLGIARGLAYLHEECRECIIHCDIKPENILLDAGLRPKIADFGMAKLLERDISRVFMTMRGTIGYLAPEWLSGLPITTKADVYSFGMMLFELVSGRRNLDSANATETGYFPAWAASRTIEGDVLGLVDDRIKDDLDLVELARVCKVACWCIQDREADRPSMSQVVKFMEGVIEMNKPSLPRALQHVL